jgi:hypothetical protein
LAGYVTELRNITQRTDPLLGRDHETSNETTAVVRQQPAYQWTGWKAVFSAGSAPLAVYATMNTTMETVFSVLSTPRCCNQLKFERQFCMRVCEGRN